LKPIMMISFPCFAFQELMNSLSEDVFS